MNKTKEEILVKNGNKDLDADLILSMMEDYSQSQLSEYKQKLKSEIIAQQESSPYDGLIWTEKVLTLIDKI